jgi:hypothetical protein
MLHVHRGGHEYGVAGGELAQLFGVHGATIANVSSCEGLTYLRHYGLGAATPWRVYIACPSGARARDEIGTARQLRDDVLKRLMWLFELE